MGKKIAKRLQTLRAKVDSQKIYDVQSGVSAVKSLASAKFDETVEVALCLGVDPRHADQMIRGAVVLPHGTGKKVRVAVFAKGIKADEAKNAGADVVGADDLADEIKNGNINFDIVIATPDMMALVGKVGRILGPKGLMPNPKTGTVTMDVAKAVSNARSGQVDNMLELVRAINKLKPTSAKGKYIRSSSVSLTMSPAIKLDSQELMDTK